MQRRALRRISGFLALTFSTCLAGATLAQTIQAAPPSATTPAKGKVVKASSFGFDPADATKSLQAAINSGAAKVIVDNPGKPWIVTPIALAGDQEIFFEKGVEVLAKAGEFRGGGDSLFHAKDRRNITLSGYGATLRMRRSDYAKPPYAKAEWRHVLCLQGCSNVRILGLTLAESGGDGIYIGATGDNPLCKNVYIKAVFGNHLAIVSGVSGTSWRP